MEDLLAFWPLNEEYGGRDLVTPVVSDIHLYVVTFDDNSGAWRSAPARFAGSSTSYGQIVNSPHLALPGSFSWMAAFRQLVVQRGPLFNVDVGGSYGVHIWLFDTKLHFFNRFPTCTYDAVTYSRDVVVNEWHEVAMVYDHENRQVSIWMDGQLETFTLPSCPENMLTSHTISIGKR